MELYIILLVTVGTLPDLCADTVPDDLFLLLPNTQYYVGAFITVFKTVSGRMVKITRFRRRSFASSKPWRNYAHPLSTEPWSDSKRPMSNRNPAFDEPCRLAVNLSEYRNRHSK